MVIDGAGMGMSGALSRRMIVLTRAAGDHRRRRDALHRQSDRQQDHQSETNETKHVQSLSDRLQTRRPIPKPLSDSPNGRRQDADCRGDTLERMTALQRWRAVRLEHIERVAR